MVGAVFTVSRREAAANHATGDLLLEMEEPGGGVDLSDKDAGPLEGIQSGESDREGGRVKLVQFMLDRGQPLFGNFAKKDKRKVDVLRCRPAAFGE